MHIESNGSVPVELPPQTWLTVSPKERLHPLMAARADEIKLIVDGRVPLEWLDAFPRREVTVFLQPEGNKPANVALALAAERDGVRRYRDGEAPIRRPHSPRDLRRARTAAPLAADAQIHRHPLMRHDLRT